MPIDGHSDYPPVMALFLSHWNDVNTELGVGNPLVLPGGMDRDQFSTDRDTLVTFAATVQDKLNDLQIARGTIDGIKVPLVERIAEFNRKVRGFLANSPFVRALPDVPSVGAGEGKILAPLDDMASLWGKINAATIPDFTPPLLLPDGLDLAAFNTDVASLKTSYASYQGADQDLRLEREKRNDVQDKVYEAIKAYRKAVQGSFAPDHALVGTLPSLTASAGSTPSPVTASGEWDETTQEAVISWSASSATTLAHYEIRMTPGATYNSNNDSQVDTVPPGTAELRTNSGLLSPGDVATFRVYVVLSTGNKAASNDVTITRM